MKNKLFKSMLALSWLLAFSLLTFTSCEEEEGGGDDPDPILVEDGLYIVGDATPFTDLDPKGALMSTKNEVVQEERTELKEIYIALKGGSTFHIESVAGAEKQTWGPGADFAVVGEADRDGEEPQVDFWRGTYEAGEATFTVPNDGLYHVVMDTELQKIAIAPVVWGVIGAATPGGWGGSTALDLEAFDQNTMTFKKEEVIMVVGDYKFRYSNGWKIILDAEYDLGGGNKGIKVNTNYGGALDALTPGGDNIANAENGLFTIEVTWSLTDGTSASVTKTGEYTPPAYPDAVYLVGDATAYGWDTPGTKDDAVFHKADGGSPTEGLFWKIAYLEADKGFKISEADWGTINLGFAEVSEFDAEGIAVSDNGGNMGIAESGMYMIVLDLRDDAKKVSVRPAAVYGIGVAFGASDNWDADVEAQKFTVDNTAKTIYGTVDNDADSYRTYASHPWIPDWWNAEFVIVDGAIEYRNDSGSDPSAVAVTAGQVVTYSFDDNTGTIQ